MSSCYTLWKYNTYSLLMSLPHVSLSELFANKDKYLYRNLFVYGQAHADPAIKVRPSQSVTSANYPSVIHSNYSTTKMNQQGFTIDQTVEKSSCYFTLSDLEQRRLEVRPSRDTEFIGMNIYRASGYLELSWTQILKSMLGLLTWIFHRAIPFSVSSRYE
jgi:hypothetical protein